MSGHMSLEVWNEAAEEHDGALYPQSHCEDGCPNPDGCGPDCELPTVSRGMAWFAWYSAPGYLDRTDTVASKVGPIDAAREAFSTYGNDEPGSDDRRELARVIRQCRAQGYRK
jgi:hypothetical protein